MQYFTAMTLVQILKYVKFLKNIKLQVEEYREKLVEAVAELDEELTKKYLEGEEITIEEIKAALRKGLCNVKFYPSYLWFFIQKQRCSADVGCCY